MNNNTIIDINIKDIKKEIKIAFLIKKDVFL
jgi:hypothetical protein